MLTTYSDECDSQAESGSYFSDENGEVINDNRFYDYFREGHDEEYAERAYGSGKRKGYSSRHWCFTWNLPDNDAEARLKNNLNYKYIVWGKEIAPTTGTFHFQGYVVFESEQQFGKKRANGTYDKRTLKGRFPEVFWKPMYSTPQACIEYCKKTGDFVEYGTPPRGKGARTDLAVVCESIVQGTEDISTIATKYPQQYVRYTRGLTSLCSVVQKHRTEKPFVIWLCGISGSGKTDFAFQRHKPEDIYIKQDGTRFWNDYNQQDAIIINEFSLYSDRNPTGWKFTDFLQVLDKYPYVSDTKGSYVKLNSPFMYITSIRHPAEIWRPLIETTDFRQVFRRLDGVYKYSSLESDTDIGQFEYDRNYEINYYSPERENRTAPAILTAKHEERFSKLQTQCKSARVALARKMDHPQRTIFSENASVYSDEM